LWATHHVYFRAVFLFTNLPDQPEVSKRKTVSAQPPGMKYTLC